MVRVAFAALALLVSSPAAGADSRRDPLVSYARTGGFIGVHDSMTVFRSGAVSSTNGSFRLSARRMRALETSLRKARFSTLQRRYAAEYPVSDGFVYRVAHARRTVIVEEGGRPPLRLRRVLDLLSDILARGR